MKSDRSLNDGRSVRVGDVVEVPDAEAYPIVWAAAAAPGVRARVACPSLFDGARSRVHGDMVDYPGDPGGGPRFYPQIAVVPGTAYPLSGAASGRSYPAGSVAFVNAATAVDVVEKGGRYATQAEADAYDWPDALLDAGRPTTLVSVPSGVSLVDGSVTTQAVVVAVPIDEAERLIAGEDATAFTEPATVEVRIACDLLVVGTTNYQRGDVVQVSRGLAVDAARFEPVAGPLERPAVNDSPRLAS